MFHNYSTKRIVVVVAVVSLVFAIALIALAPPEPRTDAVSEVAHESIVVATATSAPYGECVDLMTKRIIDQTMTGQNRLAYLLPSVDNDTDMTLIAGLMNAHDRRDDEIAVRLSNVEPCGRDVLISTRNVYDFFTSSYDDAMSGDFDIAYYNSLGAEFWQEYREAFGDAAAAKLSDEMSNINE